MRTIGQLREPEILALAISSEEEDGWTYADFAESLRATHPQTAKIFSAIAEEDAVHRNLLIDLYRENSASTSRNSGARTCARPCTARCSGGWVARSFLATCILIGSDWEFE